VCLSICENISGVTRAIFTDFWATVCKTVRPMLSVSCLSVTFVHCGQTVERIKTKLGMQVGLGPGHIALDGDPAPHPKGHSPHPIFGPYLLRPTLSLRLLRKSQQFHQHHCMLSCDSRTIVLMKSQQYCGGIYSTMAVDTTSALSKSPDLLLILIQHLLLILIQHFMLRIIPHFCCQNLCIYC